MNEKEILISIKSSIDNTPIDLLDKIKAQPKIKMSEHDHITKQENRKNTIRKFVSYGTVAAMFALLFIQLQVNNNVMTSRIYLDVNPSISIELNKKEKAIALTASNKDGKEIIKDIKYKGKSAYTLTDEVISKMVKENYISKSNQFVLLSVYNKDGQKAKLQKNKLEDHIQLYLKKKRINPIILTQDFNKESEGNATKYGLSKSKMILIKRMIKLNPDFEIRKLKGLSIHELINLSQKMNLDLDKLIGSKDIKRIKSIYKDKEDDKDDIDDDDEQDIDDDDDEQDIDENDDKDDNHDKEVDDELDDHETNNDEEDSNDIDDDDDSDD